MSTGSSKKQARVLRSPGVEEGGGGARDPERAMRRGHREGKVTARGGWECVSWLLWSLSSSREKVVPILLTAAPPLLCSTVCETLSAVFVYK